MKWKETQLCIVYCVIPENQIQQARTLFHKCMLNGIVESRNNDIAYSIDADDSTIDVAYGRDNSPTTTRTKNPHTADFVFFAKDVTTFSESHKV